MKRSNLILGLIWLALSALPFSLAQAQDNEPGDSLVSGSNYDRILKLHPLQIGEIYLSYEKMRTERISNEFGLSYVYRGFLKGDNLIPESVKAGGVHMRMSQRYYTSRKQSGAPFGFFHGPMFGYSFLMFDEDVFGEVSQEEPGSPSYEFVGRMYQNAIDLNYQLGGQFMVHKQLTIEVAAVLGARLKYIAAKGADQLLTEHIIGHALVAEKNSAIFIAPSPQLNVSLGYSF